MLRSLIKIFYFLFIYFFLIENLMAFTLKSQAINSKGNIAQHYTCEGGNYSPPLVWQEIPTRTKSFVLFMEDPDAAQSTWIHWIVYNIPVTWEGLKENSAADSSLLQGMNSWNKATYGGPCPPSGTHHYVFKLYALDTELPLAAGSTKAEVENKMAGHVLAEVQLIGTYTPRN